MALTTNLTPIQMEGESDEDYCKRLIEATKELNRESANIYLSMVGIGVLGVFTAGLLLILMFS